VITVHVVVRTTWDVPVATAYQAVAGWLAVAAMDSWVVLKTTTSLPWVVLPFWNNVFRPNCRVSVLSHMADMHPNHMVRYLVCMYG
jgi:hypothetical protein